MVILVATEIASARADPLAIVRLASDAGAAGIHLARGCLLGDVAAIATEALRAGLAVPSMTLPLPERAPAPGKRLPHMSAAEPDERAAALALAREGLAAGAALGVTRALLDFGPVALPVARAEVAASFARRELGEGEVGASRFARALEARRARAAALHDACRFSLERLARDAEARGMTLLLPTAGTPWGLPSPREAQELLAAFAGAPLAVAWDPGQLSVLRALELPLSDERVRALAAGAGASLENDAVGLEAGYLPGLGERAPGLPSRPSLAAGAPVIVTGHLAGHLAGHLGVSDVELAEAVARLADAGAGATPGSPTAPS